MDRSPYDPHVDGRPPVGMYGDDPMLDALIREHPELIPPELIDQLAASRGRSF